MATIYNPFARYLLDGVVESPPQSKRPPSGSLPSQEVQKLARTADVTACMQRGVKICGADILGNFARYSKLKTRCSQDPTLFQQGGDAKQLCRGLRTPGSQARPSSSSKGESNTTKATPFSINPALMSPLFRGAFALRDGLQAVGHEVKETAKEHPYLAAASVVTIGAVLVFAPELALLFAL